MKRQLDKQETKETYKGMVVVKDRIKRIAESISFNTKSMIFQKQQDMYQDAVRPYLRKKKAEEDKRIMDTLNQNLAMETVNLNNLQDQIKNGVTVKTPVEE